MFDPPVHRSMHRGRWLATGLFAPAIIWFLHLFLVSIAAEWGVLSGLDHRRLIGVSMVKWGIAVLSAFAISATLLSLHLFRKYESSMPKTGDSQTTDDNSFVFLSSVAFYSGMIFLVVTCVQTIPILFFLGRS